VLLVPVMIVPVGSTPNTPPEPPGVLIETT
jgi:hypothetical protein